MEQKYSSKEIIKNIYEYDDYRVFLRDYFDALKRENSQFSQRSFAQWAGFKAHNYCTYVIQGKRNLSTDSLEKLMSALKLNGPAAKFFRNLVHLNQAKTIEEKDLYYSNLKKVVKKTEFFKLNKEQFFFYEKWYYPVIRELITFAPWNNDFSLLAKMVRPPIATIEAKEAVSRLLHSKMVLKDDDDNYSLNQEFVTSAHVPVYIKKKSRRDVLLKGVDTIDNVYPQDKYMSYSTISISKSLYKEIRKTLDDVRHKVMNEVSTDTEPEEVYEFVLQVFPVSDIKGV